MCIRDSQNSLPSSKQTHGAQVFYGKKEGSAEVANAVQLALNQTVNAGNELSLIHI